MADRDPQIAIVFPVAAIQLCPKPGFRADVDLGAQVSVFIPGNIVAHARIRGPSRRAHQEHALLIVDREVSIGFRPEFILGCASGSGREKHCAGRRHGADRVQRI